VRHGRLVYNVCRNILRSQHDAEDAFQGTFLILARQAEAIREEKALAGWLYRVAYRVAMKARKAEERRQRREELVSRPEEVRSTPELAWRELQAQLDEELNRLPLKYQLPFVLCCLTGKSKSEAAAELGWKEGTVSSRLAHGRKMLQTRLARRGVTLSAILTGLAVAPSGTASLVPTALLAVTQSSAIAFAAGTTITGSTRSSATALAQAALQGMALSRLKFPAVSLILLGLFGSAAAIALYRSSEHPPETIVSVVPGPSPEVAQNATTPSAFLAKAGLDERAAGKRMLVSGSVVGPEGQPLPGASVMVMAAHRQRPGETFPDGFDLKELGSGQADNQGRFRLSVPQTTAGHYRLTVYASAPGHAFSSAMADPAAITASEHTLPLQLVRGQTVRIQLVDRQGQPARHVQVHVLGQVRNGPAGLHALYRKPPVPLPGWPDRIVTDDNGCCTFRDVGPLTRITLRVQDERFATEWLNLVTGKEEQRQPTVLTLSQPRFLEGRVLAADTRKPLADARIIVETALPGALRGHVEGRTDLEGRYRLQPFPGDRLEAWVYPVDGAPYLTVRQDLKWPNGAETYLADLLIPPGVRISGIVKEAITGEPIPDATVSFQQCLRNNPIRDALMARGVNIQTRNANTRADGTFSLTVPPGPARLLVKAAEPDFIHVETSDGWLLDNRKGGTPLFPDGVVRLQLQVGSEPPELTIPLHKGVSLSGRVIGHNGKPVASAVLLSPSYIPEGLESKGSTLPIQDGRFELPGCAPGEVVKVWIYDHQNEEGAVAELRGVAGVQQEVRLAPCVSARLHVMDQDGTLVPQPDVMLDLILRPGDTSNDSIQRGTRAGIFAWTQLVFGRDHEPTKPGGGIVNFARLIPGATYAVRIQQKVGWPEALTFTAPREGFLELKPVKINPPQLIPRK
jgi:RNA polymerase sigma factor (sigma-70 family)